MGRLPKVEGQEGEVSVSRSLANLLNVTDKEAPEAWRTSSIASELFLLALAEDKGEIGKLLRSHGVNKNALEQAIEAVRGGQGVQSQEAEGTA
jgi:ATP-dependent Clp protease ATP-binding subunit ClpB